MRCLLKAGGRQRTVSNQIVAAARALIRDELVGKAMWPALDDLAVVAREWLREVTQAEWKHRYAWQAEDDLPPTKDADRAVRALKIGHDGGDLDSMVSGSAPLVGCATLRR